MAENDRLEDIVEIHADQIDSEAIMRTIRANLQQRRVAAQTRGLNFEALDWRRVDSGFWPICA